MFNYGARKYKLLTETETDRQTETETDRGRERQRQTETDTERDRERERRSYRFKLSEHSLGNVKSSTDLVLMHDMILSIPRQQQYFIDKTVAITNWKRHFYQ